MYSTYTAPHSHVPTFSSPQLQEDDPSIKMFPPPEPQIEPMGPEELYTISRLLNKVGTLTSSTTHGGPVYIYDHTTKLRTVLDARGTLIEVLEARLVADAGLTAAAIMCVIMAHAKSSDFSSSSWHPSAFLYT